MKSTAILDILKSKHREDVFIPECKTGETGAGCLRLDAWAMKKSWAHPTTFGYEIKVSRSDFLRDEKWRDYLAYCNMFYFVCPRKLIMPEELPEEAGLIWVGDRAVTKKKAPHREVQIPEDLFRYLLMWRLTKDTGLDTESAQRQHALKLFVESKRNARELGGLVTSKLVLRQAQLERTQQEQATLLASYADLRVFLQKLGVSDLTVANPWLALQQTKQQIRGIVGQELIDLNGTLHTLASCADNVLRIRDRLASAVTDLEQTTL